LRHLRFTDAASYPHIVTSTATINQASIAVGGKINRVGKLLGTANALFVDDAGPH